MFVIILNYIKPFEEVEKLVPPHLEFLDKYYEQSKFICSGPREPWTGGVIVANVDSLKSAQAIIAEDPFFIHRIAEYEIVEFTPWKHHPQFSCFLDKQNQSLTTNSACNNNSKENKIFAILLKYLKPEEVEKQLEPHVEFLTKHYDRSDFICSGPRIPWTGGLILTNADSLASVQTIIKEDPFYTNKIAEYDVIEFLPWKYDKRFSCFLTESKKQTVLSSNAADFIGKNKSSDEDGNKKPENNQVMKAKL